MKLTSSLRKTIQQLRDQLYTQADLRREFDRAKQSVREGTPDNPASFGYKIYSQCDEDGIIENIFSRIGNGTKVFVEIGCSDGLENNTHAMILREWHGVWIDADKSKIRRVVGSLPKSQRLCVKCALVSDTNAWSTVKAGLDEIGASTIDFLSLDIDGNDLHVLHALLEHTEPRVLCVEYNAKFPPPMRISVKPGTKGWEGDDYQGASLSSFTDMLNGMDYRLVCCGLSGVNAFFVRGPDASRFSNYTQHELYQPARYYLRRLASGHPSSLKFLADALAE